MLAEPGQKLATLILTELAFVLTMIDRSTCFLEAKAKLLALRLAKKHQYREIKNK